MHNFCSILLVDEHGSWFLALLLLFLWPRVNRQEIGDHKRTVENVALLSALDEYLDRGYPPPKRKNGNHSARPLIFASTETGPDRVRFKKRGGGRRRMGGGENSGMAQHSTVGHSASHVSVHSSVAVTRESHPLCN